MKNLKLLKVLITSLALTSVLSLNSINASAAWQQDSNGWWNSEGSSYSVGWKEIDNKWYYFGNDGYMKTNWQEINGQWYYFDISGYMKTGWIQDGNSWYYLNSNGTMAKNTTIDNYVLGSNGAWIKSQDNSSLNADSKNGNTTLNTAGNKKISEIAGVNFDNITKITFYEGEGGQNEPLEVSDKQKIKEFMNYLNGYIVSSKEEPNPVAGWAHAAAFYIGDKKVMQITFGTPLIINGNVYTLVQSSSDLNNSKTDKISDFLKSLDSSK